MNKAGFSGKPQNSSPEPGDDIPAALRDFDPKPQVRFPPIFLVGGLVGFVLLAGIGSAVIFRKSAEKTVVPPSVTTGVVSPPTPTSANSDVILGHLTYPEAPAAELVPITTNGRLKMRKAAAAKLQSMIIAAQGQGVRIVPISGFRSVKEQEQLFFNVGAQRNQTPAQRAALSAPPGHSEHHTGYALDVGDGAVPATDLQPQFDQTKAYQWLQVNAARFGFELSFPKDNSQGVSYEPWHWRFVGDRDSLELFYKARNLKPTKTP